jgi:phospholipase A1
MRKIFKIVLLSCLSSLAVAETRQQCLLAAIDQAAADDTVAELRMRCADTELAVETDSYTITDIPSSVMPTTAVEDRLKKMRESDFNRFAISAYNRNYLLPVTYRTNPSSSRNDSLYGDLDFDQAEVKFQLSMQAPVAGKLLGTNTELWATYTQQSWWQLYNTDNSAPFRETNYEPELLLRFAQSGKALGFNWRLFSLGYNHQSNGQGGDLSRSWNRLFASIQLDRSKLAISGRVWWRIPESAEDDDNPDIEHYMGYGDIKAAYKWHEQVISATLRNNLRSDNKGAVQLDWTFPLGDRFKGYVQYFTGYGESLIDYDQSVNRIGVGVVLTDWL